MVMMVVVCEVTFRDLGCSGTMTASRCECARSFSPSFLWWLFLFFVMLLIPLPTANLSRALFLHDQVDDGGTDGRR